ncbi:MAG TPA: diguanylate cyclase, partial [Burkholderiaceae bacterium]|nr:diguanylate cyclase [Burkholderiaceae bacterium]
ELMRQLPVLVWLVDPAGRVVYAHGDEPWRWGMQRPPQERPLWFDAFALRNGARVDVQTALQKAAAGKPTYDLINSRGTKTGGRIVVRSHFVPYRGAPPPGMAHAGTLVLDTIAAPQQLAEIDRLRRSKAQYRALVEASTSLIWACDAQFRFTFVSRRAAREIYGYEPEELIGESLAKLFPAGADQAGAKQALAQLRLGKTLRNVEMVHAAKNGSRLVVSLSAVPTKASDGGFGGAIGMNADLTVLKLRERRLTEALRIERTVLDSAGQAIAVVKDGLVARCNDAFLRLLQAEPAALARTPLADYFAAVDEWEAIASAAEAARAQDRAATREVQIRRGSRAAGQASAWCQLTARAIAPGEYVIVLADIDHIRQREEEALHDAHHDELTGLANRRLLTARAASAFAAAALRNARCALFVIDLDGFKEINDRYGHDIGDRVLREIAARLARAMRPQDTVARRGGDEFAVLVPDAGQLVDAERIAQRLLAAIAQPVEVPGALPSVVSASIGIALMPDHGRDLERLLQLADLAMYEAKLRGKNRYAFAAEAGGVVGPLAPRAAQAS